jgi:predicted TPR repeat methyltransferase
MKQFFHRRNGIAMPKRFFSNASCEEVLDGYDAWAPTYDRDVDRLGYRTPATLARLVERHCPQRNAHLLDIGAGTGLVGDALRRRGYRHLTGLDASASMLRQAARKGVYKRLVRMHLGGRLGFRDQSFDGIVAGGVYSPGNAPLSSLAEIGRLVRHGGWIFTSLQWDGWYEKQFQRSLERPGAAGRWRCQACSAVYGSWPGVADGPRTRVLVYRIQPVSSSAETD